MALRADPELASMIPAIAIMGGSLSGGNITPAAEFNLYVDPEAARIVFRREYPPHHGRLGRDPQMPGGRATN